MAYINVKAVKSQAAKLAAPRYIDAAYRQAQKAVEIEKAAMLKEFDNHPVTNEIKLGPEAKNISNTLGGYGNLCSYIGFEEEEEDPTEIVRDILESDVKVIKTHTGAKYKKDSVEYSFPVLAPDIKTIEKVTPLPWENGRSWVRGIERGISGIGNYLYGFFEASRSTTGIQSANKRGRGPTAFKSVKYLSEILSNFRKKIK